jgi:hypothetical protein
MKLRYEARAAILIRGQSIGNARHRWFCGHVISLTPLGEPPLQVGIRQASETGNLPDALGIGAVTGSAGGDVVLRNPFQIYVPSDLRERPVSIIGRRGRKSRKISGEIARRLGSEIGRGSPHVLL